MPSVLSTKKLQLNQRELLLNAGCSFVEYDAITIELIPFEFPKDIENIIITSQNGATQILTQEMPTEHYFVVGKKTEALLSNEGLKVVEIAQNSAELAHFIAKDYKKAENLFSKIPKTDASYYSAQLYLGNTLLAQKQYKKAIPVLQNALEVDKESGKTSWYLALALLGDGQKEEAQKLFEDIKENATDSYYSELAEKVLEEA